MFNLHNKLVGNCPAVYRDPVSATVLAVAVGAGSTIYAQKQQEKAAEADRKRREKEAAASKAEADRIARETKPEEEALGETKFGADDATDVGGSTQDFLIPKTSALGGSTGGRSGLGFTV